MQHNIHFSYGRQGNNDFEQENLKLLYMLENEPEPPLIVCKHKHMLKNGAPPNNISLATSWNLRFHQLNPFLRFITFWFMVSSQFF